MNKPAIVYDGECRFCLWSVGRIQRVDHLDQFEYLPRQNPDAEARFPLLSASDFSTGLRLVVAEGKIHVGADSVYEIYRRIPPFKVITWLYRVPLIHTLFKACYALIARNRHLFGRVECETEACDVPYSERGTVTPRSGKGP